LIIGRVIPEAAFVGNGIAYGLDTKPVAFCVFLRFPKVKNFLGQKVASHMQRGMYDQWVGDVPPSQKGKAGSHNFFLWMFY
jgi:hypothetical protein